MAEDLPKEELLRKMLNMTTSDNDGQALVAIRKANALLASAGWDWDKLLAGKIKIVENPFKNMPNPASRERVERPAPPPPPPKPQQRPLMPSHSPGNGNEWYWDSWTDAWLVRAKAAPPRPTPPPPQRGLGLTRTNMYAGHCYCCGDYVPNNDGFILKPRDLNYLAPDRWAICCKPCNSSLRAISPRAAMKNTGQTTVHAPAPDLGKL